MRMAWAGIFCKYRTRPFYVVAVRKAAQQRRTPKRKRVGSARKVGHVLEYASVLALWIYPQSSSSEISAREAVLLKTLIGDRDRRSD
jgi:hypothetical protein